MSSEFVADVKGRDIISTKVLERIAEAVTAEFLQVSAKGVRATASDTDRLIVLQIKSPISVPALGAGSVNNTLAERFDTLRQQIADRFGEIAGRKVGNLQLTISGAEIQEEARV